MSTINNTKLIKLISILISKENNFIIKTNKRIK